MDFIKRWGYKLGEYEIEDLREYGQKGWISPRHSVLNSPKDNKLEQDWHVEEEACKLKLESLSTWVSCNKLSPHKESLCYQSR